MNFLYHLTSINSYSFGLLVFLFAFAFLINNKKISYIIFIRISLLFLILSFYFIGWNTLEYGKYNKMLGKTIPYHSQVLKVCSMRKVNELVNGNLYNNTIAKKYECTLEKANNAFFKYSEESKFLIKNKIIEPILIKENFTVIDSINLYSVGLLKKSFGNDYKLLIIRDTKNNIYIAEEYIMEEEEK